MAKVIEVTDDTFEKEIIKSEIQAIVDFWAEWCTPCKKISPVIEEIAKEVADKIKVGKINIDENTKIATDFAVMSIPALLFFKDGKEIGRTTGIISKNELLRKIEELF